MSQLSDYLETQLIIHMFKGTAYTAPGTVFFACGTANPGEAGAASTWEVASGKGYVRGTVVANTGWGADSGGTVSNAALINFGTATADWGTVTHMAIMHGATLGAGTILFYGTVTTNRIVLSGDVFQVPAGSLSAWFA